MSKHKITVAHRQWKLSASDLINEGETIVEDHSKWDLQDPSLLVVSAETLYAGGRDQRFEKVSMTLLLACWILRHGVPPWIQSELFPREADSVHINNLLKSSRFRILMTLLVEDEHLKQIAQDYTPHHIAWICCQLEFNAFTMTLRGVRMYLVGRTINKVDHSCIPNAQAKCEVSDRTLSFVLSALKDIVEGEEITISYLTDNDLQLSVGERRQILVETWQFLCRCRRCITESHNQQIINHQNFKSTPNN